MGKENELIAAVKEGNCQYVRKSLHKYRKSTKKPSGKKSTINVIDAEGFTALHHAALQGDVEIIMAIIEMEGDPNTKDKKGMTPLHMAAWAGKESAVKCLVENRALPNLPSLNGETALHLAAQHGYASCAKVLLGSHADGTFRNTTMETPLDLASQYGHTSVVKQLLQNEAVTFALTANAREPRSVPPLHLAAKSGHDDIAHLLLQAGADVNESTTEGTALHLAGLYGKTNVVRLLLSAGADVAQCNKDGLTALDVVKQFTASRAGLEIKQMLREAAGERVTYAKAVSDYNNQYDDTCLSFKAGDSIAVLDQNEDGRWRGYVVISETEKTGFFPAMTVQLLAAATSSTTTSATVKPTTSINSMASSVSSVDSGFRLNLTPERRKEPSSPGSPVAVGMVPIGNFEVLTLAQGDQESTAPPKQTAAGSLPPRMSSFSYKHQQKKNNRTTPTSPVHSPRSTPKTKGNQPPPPPPPQRSISDDSHPYVIRSGSMVTSRSVKQARQHESEDMRGRAASAGTAQIEFSKVLKQAIVNRNDADKHPTKTSTSNYADVEFKSQSSTPNNTTTATRTSYTTVYFSDETDGGKIDLSDHHSNSEQAHHQNILPNIQQARASLKSTASSRGHDPNLQTGSSDVVQQHQQQLQHQQQVYEDMTAVHGTVNKPATTTTAVNDPRIRAPTTTGYEDMTGVFVPRHGEEENEAVSPRLIVKEPVPQLPLKRCNTAPQPKSPPPVESIQQYKSPPKQTRNTRATYENHNFSQLEVVRTNSLESGSSRPPPSFLPPPPPHPSGDVDFGGRRSPLNQRSSETDREVLSWLGELKLSTYHDAFKSHGFDMDSIRAITPEDLNFLEISKTGHRKKLLSEIAKLPPLDRLPTNRPHDVGAWLGQLNMRQYEPNFVEGGFDDMEFIKDLDKNDLEMIDIKKRGHQKKLLLAVRQLNDMELTDVLDQAVLESPIKRIPSFNRTPSSNQSSEFQFPFNSFQRANEEEMATTAVFPREDLPPPSGEEQKHAPPSPRRVPPVALKPNGTMAGKKPVPAPSAKPSVPATKPKPKPAIKPLPNGAASPGNVGKVSMEPPRPLSGEIQGSQEETVTSSKSRDFFKMQDRKTSTSSTDSSRKSSFSSDQVSPPGTIKRAASTGKPTVPPPAATKPAVPPPATTRPAVPPPAASKPKPIKPVPEVQVVSTPPAPVVAAKKLPPPAPPKRGDSIKDVAAPNPPPLEQKPKPESPVKPPVIAPDLDLCISPPLPNFTPPPPGPAPAGSPTVDFPPPPPIELIDDEEEEQEQEQPPREEENPPTQQQPINAPPPPERMTAMEQKAIDDEFGATDDILSDIMADLDDFSSQLDKMF